MSLSALQVADYSEDGFVAVPSLWTEEEIQYLRILAAEELGRDSPGRVLEADARTIRAVHGCHLWNSALNRLAADARLVEPARQLLGDDVYIYQFKINGKADGSGGSWPWHQDYAFWMNEDGMRSPRALTVAVCLDDVTAQMGPMEFLRGSQREGLVGGPTPSPSKGSEPWQDNFRDTLPHQIDPKTLESIALDYPVQRIEGPAGTTLFFDPCVIHGSGQNRSESARRLLLVSYNAMSNALAPPSSRPEFLVSRHANPVVAVSGDLTEARRMEAAGEAR